LLTVRNDAINAIKTDKEAIRGILQLGCRCMDGAGAGKAPAVAQTQESPGLAVQTGGEAPSVLRRKVPLSNYWRLKRIT
jgi:hypothetical protein